MLVVTSSMHARIPFTHLCGRVSPYFTREKRGYQLPSSENIIYSELPRIKQEKRKKYDRDVELKLLRYHADFGQGNRQQNIRAFTTKDKPGTLPFYIYTEQDDCSAKTLEKSFDVFNVLLDNSRGKHKEYELDEQLEERGVDTYVNEQEGSKSGSYIYVVKQSLTNGFIGFLQRSKPVPTATRSVSGEIYRQSADENFKFSKCGKGTVKLKDILCDAFITLPSIAINNDTITISEIDYCKILPSV